MRTSTFDNGQFNPLRWPITTGTALLALANTLLWWSGHYNVDGLVLTGAAFWREPWRLLTSTLLHGGLLHLLFNLYWLWIFGRWLEAHYGQARTLLIFIAFAVGSGAAEYALFRGGVGLSGVGYGLFGFLWAAGRRDGRFAPAVDYNTAMLFVGWFFFCIAATAVGALNIANVAHGMGALLGASLGFAATTEDWRRIGYGALFAALTAISLAGASVARPYVNISGGEVGIERKAEHALDQGHPEEAVEAYRRAIESYGETARLRYNLGVALQRTDENKKAARAFAHAAELAPTDENYSSAAAETYLFVASRALQTARYEEAIDYVERAHEFTEPSAKSWTTIGVAHRELGHDDRSRDAFERAQKLGNGPPTSRPDAGSIEPDTE